MNYSEEIILKKTTELLNELGSLRDDYKPTKAIFDEKEKLARGENKDKEHPCWIVVIDDTSFFDTTDFLTISDETGEPLYFQTKHKVYEIFKNEEGKYYLQIEEQ